MTIIIRTVGNPGLYRDLQASVASETRHRTVSGALRRLERIERDARDWTRAMGRWGRVEIQIDGDAMDATDVDAIRMSVAEYLARPQDDFSRRYAADMLTA